MSLNNVAIIISVRGLLAIAFLEQSDRLYSLLITPYSLLKISDQAEPGAAREVHSFLVIAFLIESFQCKRYLVIY